MQERYERLRGFLAAGTAAPFVWGQNDCSMWCASWIRDVHGIDPAAAFRGTYATADECAALVEQQGGLEAFADRLLTKAGMRRAIAPEPGDVAVVHTLIGPAMMIYTGLSWAWKSPHGVLFARREPIVAWAV